MADAVESMARRFALLAPHLTELQQRLWLGVEASELGSGGVGVVAEAVSVATDTVRRGRAEALGVGVGVEVPAMGRSRRPGGGRKRAEAHDADLVTALELLIEPTTRGDPGSPLRWTTLSIRNLAKALTEQGHRVSEFVVRRLLKQLGYSLQANAKDLEGKQHPDRDAQFRYLAEQSTGYLDAGDPVISIDTKKKELIGDFYREGAIETQGTIEVNDHDFGSMGSGTVIPHGIYDVGLNRGFVHLNTSHDTSELACDSVATWWEGHGRATYPRAAKLLVLCDGGGSNSASRYVFKEQLQGLADRLGVEIRVAHYPPYCSKYNPIEHRLFPHMTRACRGVIFRTLETVRYFMSKAGTTTGLEVEVSILEKVYETGRKCADEFRETMRIVFDEVLPKWNYRAVPRSV
jgi:hypothetical protein